jgi:translation initiation factor 3 subunit L
MSKGDYYEEHHIHNDVKTFIKKLGKNLRAKDMEELQNLYEKEFMVLTDRFYKASKWPTPDSVATCVEGDRNSLVLYKDLYYRHIYNKLDGAVTVDDRFNSFHNYINFFNTLLGLTTSAPELALPAVWLWDIIDEFIYQFRTFHTMRGSHRKSDNNSDEVQFLKDHPHVWSAQTVIQYLHALVNKANKGGQVVAPFFKWCAEFALIGLCRVNVLLGDYYGALQALDTLPLDMSKRPYYDCQGLLACHTTLHYYMSFAYVMLNRFGDAITTITDAIIYINRNKQFLPRSYQEAIITKKTGCMLNLLAIAVSVTPQSLDESVKDMMVAQISEANLSCMVSNEHSIAMQAFEQAFEHACPTFINPAIPDFDSIAHIEDEARAVQVRVFLSEIKERISLAALTKTLELCNTVSVKKLTVLAKKDSNEELISDLLSFKIKNKQLKHKDAKPPLTGVWSHASPVNFFFKNDVVTVSESVEQDRYGEYFMSQILKYEDFIDEARQVRQ